MHESVRKSPMPPAVHSIPIHPDLSSRPIGRSSFSGQAAVATNQLVRFYLSPSSLVRPSGVGGLVSILTAIKAIQDKAAQLGFAGSPLGDVEGVPGGYVGRYQACDIYYSPSTGAHEVNGEIKAKYDAILGPASVLGLPTTDESDVGDGMGRFNNFQHGSIYWTAHTGPMRMMIPIRDFWLSQGGAGVLGYPVYDELRDVAFTPSVDPHIEYCGFENGIVVQSPDGILAALAAVVLPNDLKTFIRSTFDKRFHATGNNIGLHPNVEIVEVGSWGHGFWASTPRDITIDLHGFHDNGLWADTDFKIRIGLSFSLAWQPSFSEPRFKTLVANLTFLRVTADGTDLTPVVPGAVIDGVANGIHAAFYPDTPDAAHPEVLPGSLMITEIPVMTPATPEDPSSKDTMDVMGVTLAADGTLQIFVNPLPATPGNNIGLFRKNVAQQQVDAFIFA